MFLFLTNCIAPSNTFNPLQGVGELQVRPPDGRPTGDLDVLGGQGKRHRDEVLKFTEMTKNDGIKFHSITYQELIVHLANKLRIEHPGYIRYLTDRYLQCKWIALPGNFEPCLALDGYSAGSP